MLNAEEIVKNIVTTSSDKIDKEALLDKYQEPVSRFFHYHLPDGIPDQQFFKIPMTGIIKLVSWTHFKSILYAHPFIGFLWQATLKMGILPIKGYDYLFKDQGATRWTFFKVIPFMSESGDKVTRSAEGRAKIESLFTPHLLIHPDIIWEAVSDEEITATWKIFQETEPIHLIIGKNGDLKSAYLRRWGNPGGVKKYEYHTFGINVLKEKKYKGVIIPTKGNSGWWFGTKQYDDGECFRFEVATP